MAKTAIQEPAPERLNSGPTCTWAGAEFPDRPGFCPGRISAACHVDARIDRRDHTVEGIDGGSRRPYGSWNSGRDSKPT